jgi:hypothetical protein
MKNLKLIAMMLLVVSAVCGLVAFDFYVWRLKHPDAPMWTYFF